MNILRKYKISKLTGIIPEGKEVEAIKFMKNILNDIIPFKEETYPDSIFYMNSKGDWIFEQNNKYDTFRVRYNLVWKILKDNYSMKTSEIQELIKYQVEEDFKHKVSTPGIVENSCNTPVEGAFKHKVSTPRLRFSI